MNRKFFCCAALAVVGVASLWAADPITWKFPGAVMEWNKTYNAKLEETDDAVKVIPVKADHAIINPKTDIDPSLYNSLRIIYRANGFKQPVTTGALYFTTDKQKSYHHKFQINLPTLEVDGKRHNISVRLDSESWTSAAKITSLRLDITDQMPGDVYIEKIEFFARDAKFGTAVWDFANGEGTWDSSLKMDVTAENKEPFNAATAKSGTRKNKRNDDREYSYSVMLHFELLLSPSTVISFLSKCIFSSLPS